jgi:hypothetical protein
MEEELAQKIMAKYLEERDWKVKLKSRPSGPDFLYQGKAIEVKGSDLSVTTAALQFARYAHEYTEFGIAFPVDALNGKNLIQIHFLSQIWSRMFGKSLTLYLITEQDDRYGVSKIYNANDLLGRICYYLTQEDILREKSLEKLLKYIESLMQDFDPIVRLEAYSFINADYSTVWFLKSSIQ